MLRFLTFLNILNTVAISSGEDKRIYVYASIASNLYWCYWAQENLHEILQRPLPCPKVTAWCAISSSRIITPYYYRHSFYLELNKKWDIAGVRKARGNKSYGANKHGHFRKLFSKQTHFQKRCDYMASKMPESFSVKLFLWGT